MRCGLPSRCWIQSATLREKGAVARRRYGAGRSISAGAFAGRMRTIAQADRALAEISGAQLANSQDIVDAALDSIDASCRRRVGELARRTRIGLRRLSADRVLSAIVGQIVRQQRDEDLGAFWSTALQIIGQESHAASHGSVVASVEPSAGDALADGDSPQLAELRELRQFGSEKVVREARRALEQSESATLKSAVAAIEDLALDKFENQRKLLRAASVAAGAGGDSRGRA